MAKIAFLRHGESEANLGKYFSGQLDVALTPEGERQAIEAVPYLRGISFAAAYTSRLQRAIRTLDIVLTELKQDDIPVLRTPALNERDYGALQGRKYKDCDEEYGLENMRLWRYSHDIPPPGGESFGQVKERAVGFYLSTVVPRLMQDENMLIVAHHYPIRGILEHVGLPLEEGKILMNCHPLIYGFSPTTGCLVPLSAVPGQQS